MNYGTSVNNYYLLLCLQPPFSAENRKKTMDKVTYIHCWLPEAIFPLLTDSIWQTNTTALFEQGG